jgi:hypothetical protein
MPSARQRLHDLRGALAAAALMCRVAAALRRRAFPDLLAGLGLTDALPAAPPCAVQQAQAAVRRVHRLLPFAPNCLLDALTAAALVRRQGYSVPLAIGVRKQQGQVQAHAWLGAAEAPGEPAFQLLYRVPHED